MAFVSLKDLARSPMTVELFLNGEGNFAVRFEDHDMVFQYPVVEQKGVKGVNL